MRIRFASCCGRDRPAIARVALAALLVAVAATLAPNPAPSRAEHAELRFGTMVGTESINEAELRRLRAGGGEVLRLNLSWRNVQLIPLPLYFWGKYDAVVARAAEAGVTILPDLIGSPRFVAPTGAWPPTTAAGKYLFARFVAAAVERYGHGGRFWKSNPELPYKPIDAWEVWNEPNLRSFWTRGEPSASEYGALLKLASAAIRGADRRAKVVLAGMPEPRAERAIGVSEFLPALYRIPGVRESFDVVAAHPYAATVRGVDRKLRQIRAVMRRNGDASKPLWITELGWASAGKPEHPLVKDPATQASLTRQTLDLVRRRQGEYHLGTVIWFRWQDPERPCPPLSACWAENSGLFARDGRPKPAWRAFAEGAGGRPLSGPLPPDAFDELGALFPFGG